MKTGTEVVVQCVNGERIVICPNPKCGKKLGMAAELGVETHCPKCGQAIRPVDFID